MSTAFVNQTLGVGRAERTADGILTGESGSAALGSGARCWLSDAGRVGSRVSQESSWTGTLSSLIDNITQRIRSANGVGAAGIFTAAVNASFIGSAIGVLATTNGAHVVETNVAEETIVVHSAGQHTLSGDAFLVNGALGVASADGNATSFIASVAASAFAITTASHWNTDAFRFGRSGESGRARANGRVIYWPTLGVHTASAVQRTGIDALPTDTGLAVLTFDVGLAGWFANSAVTKRVGWAVRLSFTADRLTDASDISVGSVAFKSLAANASGFVIGW